MSIINYIPLFLDTYVATPGQNILFGTVNPENSKSIVKRGMLGSVINLLVFLSPSKEPSLAFVSPIKYTLPNDAKYENL